MGRTCPPRSSSDNWRSRRHRNEQCGWNGGSPSSATRSDKPLALLLQALALELALLLTADAASLLLGGERADIARSPRRYQPGAA